MFHILFHEKDGSFSRLIGKSKAHAEHLISTLYAKGVETVEVIKGKPFVARKIVAIRLEAEGEDFEDEDDIVEKAEAAPMPTAPRMPAAPVRQILEEGAPRHPSMFGDGDVQPEALGGVA
jgi:hypothetical protein